MSRIKGTGTIHLIASNTSRQISTFAATYNDYPKAATNNAKRALSIRDDKDNKAIQECGERTGWARANQLAKAEVLSRETVARMASFKRHQKNKDGDPTEDCGALMWLAWGGDEGIEWAINKMKEIREEEQADLSKMGFNNTKLDKVEFASAFREMTVPDSVKINEDDFLLAPFRLISATIVGAYTWKATDFSKPTVLRSAMDKLVGKPVYTQHFADPDNAVGFVKEVAWGSKSNQDGVVIPEGIDGILAIDTFGERKQNLARGIQMGAINSNSVSVEFNWEASHDFEHEYQFIDALGSVIDGKMVTRVVTNIIDFHESSLVDLGADPYAKVIDTNGNLKMIEHGSTVSKYRKEENKEELEDALSHIHNFSATLSNNEENNETKMVKKLKGKFGAALSKLMQDAIVAKVEKDQLTNDEVLDTLSAAAGVTLGTVKKVLEGKTNCPTLARMEAFAGVLDLSMDVVLKAAEDDGCMQKDEDLEAAKKEGKEELMEDKKDDDDMMEDEEDMMEDKDKKDMSKDCGCVDLQKELDDMKVAFAKSIEDHKNEIANLNKVVENKTTEFSALKTDNIALKQESVAYSKLVEANNALKADFAALKAKESFIAIGEKYQEGLTAKVIETYKKQANGNPSDAMLKAFSKMPVEDLEDVATELNVVLFDKFSYSCADCGCEKANFGTVKKMDEGESKLEKPTNIVTEDDLRKEFDPKRK